MGDNSIDYIGSDELITSNIKENIYSGGFNINSIMMKTGMSPIMTLNKDNQSSDYNNVSDLFKNLVIPSWTLSYNNMSAGNYNDKAKDKKNYDSDDSDSDIDDELHDKLLNLVKVNENELKKKTKKTKKNKIKITSKSNKKSIKKYKRIKE
jgi:hypothetical protein